MDVIQHAWIVRESQSLAEVFAGIRNSQPHGITHASVVWTMEQSSTRAYFLGEKDKPVSKWRYWDEQSNSYHDVDNESPPFVEAFLQNGAFTRIDGPRDSVKGTCLVGRAWSNGTLSGQTFPQSWTWRSQCLINEFEGPIPLDRFVRLLRSLIAADSAFGAAISRYGIDEDRVALCPGVWSAFLAFVSDFGFIPTHQYCRVQLFSTRLIDGDWIQYFHALQPGEWNLVSSSREGKEDFPMRPKYDIDNGNIWVGATWEDFFQVCEMACLWLSSTPVTGWDRLEPFPGKDKVEQNQNSDCVSIDERTASPLASGLGKDSSRKSRAWYPAFDTVADDYRTACLKDHEHLILKGWMNSKTAVYFKRIGFSFETVYKAFNSNRDEWWPQLARELREAQIEINERTRERTGKKKPTREK